MSEREAKCEDRIEQHMTGRESQFDRYFTDPDDLADEDVLTYAQDGGFKVEVFDPAEYEPEDEMTEERHQEKVLEDARDWLRDHDEADNDVLGVSAEVAVTLRVELSTGGPADFLTAELDVADGSVSDVTYHFQDWFDGAKRSVPSRSSLYSLVERYAQMYQGMSLDEIEKS